VKQRRPPVLLAKLCGWIVEWARSKILGEGIVEENDNGHGRSVAEISMEVETRNVQSFPGRLKSQEDTLKEVSKAFSLVQSVHNRPASQKTSHKEETVDRHSVGHEGQERQFASPVEGIYDWYSKTVIHTRRFRSNHLISFHPSKKNQKKTHR
jgi:hypothetical protein